MATTEEINQVLNIFEVQQPHNTFSNMKKIDSGFFAVMKYIHMSDSNVKSIDICKSLNLSSARITVLLHKLEKKELIKKSIAKDDTRAINVMLTKKGQQFAEKMHKNIINISENLIDHFGLEKLIKLFEEINIMNTIVHSVQNDYLLEEIND